MDLRKLSIRRLPGIDTAFDLTLAAGVNLIQGANGSGKSSTCRAVLALLFPDGRPDPRREVTATFQAGTRTWHAAREGTATTSWSATDGGAPPVLPASPLRAAYHLGLLDLHKSGPDADDEALVREIRSRMAGGYDLATLRESDGMRVSARRLHETVVLGQTRSELHVVQDDLRSLAADEDALADLDAQIRAADNAAARLRVLDAADRLAAARTRAAEARRRLDAMPAVLERLHGQEHARWEDLARERDQNNERLTTALAAGEHARQAMGTAGFAAAPPPEADLRVAQQRGQALQTSAADVARLEREHDAAVAAAAERGRQLGPPWHEAPHAPVSIEAIDEARRELRQDAELGARGEALATLLARPDLVGDGPDGEDGEEARLRDASGALTRWLAAPDATARDWRRGIVVLSGVAVVAAGMMARLWHTGPRGWLVLAGGTVAIVAALWPRTAARAQRRVAQQAYRETGLPEPTSWRRDDVVRRLLALNAELADAAERELRRNWRAGLQAERTRVDEQRRAQRAARRALALQHGLEPETGGLELAELLPRIAAVHEARHEEAAAAARVVTARAERDAILAELAQFLARHGVAQPTNALATDALATNAALADLAQRAQQHRDATRDLASQSALADAARARLNDIHASIAALFANLDLAPGAVADLDRLLAQRDTYLATAADHRAATAAVSLAEDEIDALGPYRDDALAAAASDDVTRATQRAALAAQADQSAALQKRYGEIDGAIAQARRQSRLQNATAAVAAAVSNLARVVRTHEDNALAHLLLDTVAQEHERRSLPAVLAEASTLFTLFTAGRYALAVHDDGFRARDRETQRPLRLRELSDGTRAQLLLAARLAFVVDIERGEPLPLLLDEALSASDPRRAAAVAASLIDMVKRDGRQLVVLTAHPETIATWQRALAAADLPPAPVTDLGVIRAEAQLPPLAALAAAVPPEIPAPDGLDPPQYARRLRVESLDVHAPVTRAHLYYLLSDDLAALHVALRSGARTWGAFAALADAAGDGATGPGGMQMRRLTVRADALAAFLAARAEGRGRAVTRASLAACGAVARSTKLAEIEALIDDVGGDAATLVAALRDGRVSNLRRSLIDELETTLRERGELDDRPRLTRDEVLARVAAAMRDAIGAGHLAPGEIDGLVTAWWRATETPDSRAASF